MRKNKKKKKHSSSRPKQRSTSYSSGNNISPESVKVKDVEIKKSDLLSSGNHIYINNKPRNRRVPYPPKPVYEILIDGQYVTEFSYWDIINTMIYIMEKPSIPNISIFTLEDAIKFKAAEDDVYRAMEILLPNIISDFTKTKVFKKLPRKNPLKRYIEKVGMNYA